VGDVLIALSRRLNEQSRERSCSDNVRRHDFLFDLWSKRGVTRATGWKPVVPQTAPMPAGDDFHFAMQQHIERVRQVSLGKPVFRGTRISVEFVLERLAQGARPEDLIRSHPPLTAYHVKAALAYALTVVR
jgi:uncharacterized protein (DUF433 family)